MAGARAYYMRNIMHDYADEKCRTILHNIIPAMDNDSYTLIDEMILPNLRPHWQATVVDLTMMANFAAMERSEKQWYELLDSAGLRMERIYTYTEELRNSVIVAVPKGR